MSQVKPSNCFRRLEKLVLLSILDTSLSSFMMWNLQSYPTIVLNEIMWHFRGSKIKLWPLLHIFRGWGQNPLNRPSTPLESTTNLGSHMERGQSQLRHLECKESFLQFHDVTAPALWLITGMSHCYRLNPRLRRQSLGCRTFDPVRNRGWCGQGGQREAPLTNGKSHPSKSQLRM